MPRQGFSRPVVVWPRGGSKPPALNRATSNKPSSTSLVVPTYFTMWQVGSSTGVVASALLGVRESMRVVLVQSVCQIRPRATTCISRDPGVSLCRNGRDHQMASTASCLEALGKVAGFPSTSEISRWELCSISAFIGDRWPRCIEDNSCTKPELYYRPPKIPRAAPARWPGTFTDKKKED